MTDRNRSTLRLRLPPTSAPPPRPVAVQAPAPTRPAPFPPARAVMAARLAGPVALDACSRAILEELAAIGLADPPEG
jgi:hypothetical protein